VTAAQALLLADKSEAEFQAIVIARASITGWREWHHRDSRTVTRRGFPDLFLMHETGRIILAELKDEDGTLRPDQREFFERALRKQDQRVELAIWRPRDLDLIDRILAGAPCPPLELPPPPKKRTPAFATPRPPGRRRRRAGD
jgi:hypothetical protein